jgi:NAD(P)-dependent dehydrogenase (short-subunit alcohol dehydrogenase family)
MSDMIMGDHGGGSPRPLAVVTGASSGIGLELAKECVDGGFDLVVASDDGEIEAAADFFRERGADVVAITADLSTAEGVEALVAAIGGRPVGALLANAGRALGHAFLDQDFDRIRGLVDTNITADELENIMYNCFHITFPEELHFGYPFFDQLAHPVQHKGGQSSKPYHGVLIPNREVPIMHRYVPEWLSRKHRIH